ncbi:pentapeptide repeat-containing protein [Amycolatopsis sp. cmx-4-61]|uniref:pentapeptide repeat-containing protein n=1 Tax=Amycolatopsis sp. cmx-4-61 TaxID=2790937 RepID=UPI00397AD16C
MANEPERVLRTRTIVLWGVGLLVVAGVAAAALLTLLGGGRPEDSARLDALKTAASIVVGTGGAAALLLAARRQRSAELELVQKDHDATERRITEMYGKAADQLGSDKAPVRLAGLYALERLAAAHPEHRQTIVNVFCAYLRMPFDPEKDEEEGQVRRAAQRILMLHLRPGRGERPSGDFWPDTDLDFSGAKLVELTLTHCVIRSITCDHAKFLGSATFRGTEFRTKADFTKAYFRDSVDFRGTVFGGERESFADALFAGPVDFGTNSAARLAGAEAEPGFPRTWPPGWQEGPKTAGSERLQLTRNDEPASR